MNSDRSGYLGELISRAKNGYEHYEKDFNRLNDAYLLCLDPETKAVSEAHNRSALYIPKLNAKAKRIADALSETYFSNDTFAKLENFINSDEKILDMWQKALDFYSAQMNLYSVFQPQFLKISFVGTAVAKVFWNGDKPKIEMLDIDRVFFDPEASGKDDVRYVVEQITATAGDIKARVKSGIYHATDSARDLSESRPYERFTLYDVYEKIENKWYLSTLYEGADVLRDKVELVDGLPIVWGYMLPQVKKWDESEQFVSAYGEPPLASMLPLQEEMNRTRNGIIDAMHAHLMPKIILNKGAQIPRADLETIGKPLYATDPASVQILPPPNIQSALSNIQITENEMSETSGVSPQQNGASTSRAETATMSSIMANEGSVRLQGYIRTFNETFFEPIFERLARLVWLYGDPIFFAGFRREEVMSYKINLNTGIGALNKEVQKRSLMEGGSLIGQHFQMCASMGDQKGAARMLAAHEKLVAQLMPLFGIKDFDKYVEEQDGDELAGMVLEQRSPNQIQRLPTIGGQIGNGGILNAMGAGALTSGFNDGLRPEQAAQAEDSGFNDGGAN